MSGLGGGVIFVYPVWISIIAWSFYTVVKGFRVNREIKKFWTEGEELSG